MTAASQTSALSLNEKEFVRLAATRENRRLDGRKPDQGRPLHISRGMRRGQVMVRLGESKVYSSVSADLSAPLPDRPFDGVLSVFVEIFPGAHSPDFPAGELDGQRQQIQRLLERSIKAARVVDTESLCILTGQRVWAVRLDVHVLDDDGAVADAALIGGIAALLDFRRPEVEIVEDPETGRSTVKLWSAFERHPVPLTIMHMPLPVSFALFGTDSSQSGSDADQMDMDKAVSIVVLVDPTAQEEGAMDGSAQLVLNQQGELVSVVKAGGLPVPAALLSGQCLLLARERSKQLLEAINSAVAK